jgi:parvulin-like peptidyl-prolyl isomerase
VHTVVGDRVVAPSATKLLQAQALDQLINRQLVLRQLERQQQQVKDAEVDLELARLRDRLARQEVTWEQFLQRLGMTESEQRRGLIWHLTWSRFLAPCLADDKLEEFFRAHHRDFDGTQVRVAHILWKADSPTERDAALQDARRVQAELERGAVTFADAARQHSQAPTGRDGGTLGWIKRHQPMPESFNQAAYQLAVGQVSPPVVTSLGVHLIQCLEEKPGTRTWQESRDELRRAVTEYVFRRLADRERPQARLEFTGAVPHFRPGTQELVDTAQ